MAISPSQAAAATGVSTAGTAGVKLTQDLDTFLKLLTAQLKNQDPLKPMDTNEFTAQLAQFSSVEQAIQTNKNLESLIAAQAQNAAGSAVNYLGHTVSIASDSVGLVNGEAHIDYALLKDAATATVTISNAAGKIVRSLAVDTAKGNHTVTWDGKDSAGNTVPDGVYNMEISAAAADKTGISATTGITGTVSSMTIVNGEPMLTIGGVSVPLSSIISVSGT